MSEGKIAMNRPNTRERLFLARIRNLEKENEALRGVVSKMLARVIDRTKEIVELELASARRAGEGRER